MASAGKIDGNIFGLYINNQLVASSTSASLDLSVATRETTTKDDAGKSAFEPTKFSGTASGDFLITEDSGNYNTLFSLLYTRQKFTWKYGTAVSGDQVRFGTGFFTSLKHSSPQNDNVSGNFSIQITGQVFVSTNP